MNGRARKNMLFIVTGMSGAGKSQALKMFQDFGFYCVDNLPLALTGQFVSLLKKRKDLGDVALGVDIREGRSLREFPGMLAKLSGAGLQVRVVFFDAAYSTLVQRYSETRHRHPLGSNLASAIKQEKKFLASVKNCADKVIDTTNMTLGELKDTLSRLLELKKSREMKISVLSFGYKYGLPFDADIVMDVRFLVNPNYVPSLKDKTGLDKPVADYVMKDPQAALFLKRFLDLIKQLLPLYVKEGKSVLTMAIGCTGGKHRSVLMTHLVSKALRELKMSVAEYHRDIGKKW